MNRNPEFLRNVWLELTPYRLAGMPAVLFAIFLLVYLIAGEPRQAMARAALSLFGLLVLLWATRLASEAVVAEIRDRTWDSQRMSAIGPWSMTWGKLLGSTIYPWYGALFCLLVYAAAVPAGASQTDADTGRTVALYTLAGLFANSVALLSSMQAVKKERRYNRSEAASFLVLGVLMAGPILSMGSMAFDNLEWFGMSFRTKDFFLVSVLAFLAWTVYGIYRLMRTELQMKNGPLAWLSFSVFFAIYCAGLVNIENRQELMFGRFFTGYVLCLMLTYLMAFSERKDPVAFRRLLVSYRVRDWKRVLQQVPSWAITLLPLAVSAFGLLVAGLPAGNDPKIALGARLSIAGSFLFVLRDLGLLLFFNLARNTKRADWIMVLSLGLLYGVFPGIMQALNLDEATVLFWPRWDMQSYLSVVGPSLEALLVLLLLVNRWKSAYDK